MESRTHHTGSTVNRFWFVGVRTKGSAAFPGWMEALGHTGGLAGVNLRIGAPDAAYLSLVERLRADPDVLGAVITRSQGFGARRPPAPITSVDPLRRYMCG